MASFYLKLVVYDFAADLEDVGLERPDALLELEAVPELSVVGDLTVASKPDDARAVEDLAEVRTFGCVGLNEQLRNLMNIIQGGGAVAECSKALLRDKKTRAKRSVIAPWPR